MPCVLCYSGSTGSISYYCFTRWRKMHDTSSSKVMVSVSLLWGRSTVKRLSVFEQDFTNNMLFLLRWCHRVTRSSCWALCVCVCTHMYLLIDLPVSPSGEAEPDAADHPKPLNLTFLPSLDILISNTYHSVRGQLLAERQGSRERARWGGGRVRGVGALRSVTVLWPLSLPGGDRGELL